MTIKQTNPVTGAPTGVIHPAPGESHHVLPPRMQLPRAADPTSAPTSGGPMIGVQNTDYFADSYGPNAPSVRAAAEAQRLREAAEAERLEQERQREATAARADTSNTKEESTP